MNFKVTNEFNKNNCYLAARFAEAVYDIEAIKALSDELGMTCIPFPVKNHFAAICKRHDYAVIAYRGTDDLKDFFTDLKYFQDNIPKTSIMVHKGVNSAYKLLHAKMANELRKIWVSGSKWIATGHSLGGGLAVRSLVDNKSPNGHCYTFGGMRVGNSAMFDHIHTQITRVVNGNDAITDLPKENMIISGCKYKHRQDRVINLNYDKTITVGNRTLWGKVKERISGGIGDVIDFDLVPDAVEDHDKHDYASILAQWEGE